MWRQIVAYNSILSSEYSLWGAPIVYDYVEQMNEYLNFLFGWLISKN